MTEITLLEKSLNICKRHLPFMDEQGKASLVLFTLMDNEKYCSDLVGYYKKNAVNVENEYQFAESLSHDLLGLSRKDECFVPRINTI